MNYGTKTAKGEMLITISQLCVAADRGDRGVSYTDLGMKGLIPSCIENGADFSQDNMRGRVGGLASVFPCQCHSLTTHDLNSFDIPKIGELITEIRMS